MSRSKHIVPPLVASMRRATADANDARRESRDADYQWVKEARKIHGRTWRLIIDQITDDAVRIDTASRVWWDWFADRPGEDRWAHLDDLMAAWRISVRAKQSDVFAALVRIGYPRHIATGRTTEVADDDSTV